MEGREKGGKSNKGREKMVVVACERERERGKEKERTESDEQ